MNFVRENQFFILFGLFLIISGAGFWYIHGLGQKIKKLFGGNEAGDMKENILARLSGIETKHEKIEPRIAHLEAIADLSIHKVGFLRYNPFGDTGGDNSFALALLDRRNNGVIITSLYMRDGMRVYAKKVEKGAASHSLSQEEKKVLASALGSTVSSDR